MTYRDDFPPGTRVIVHAPDPREGSDHEFHGRTGTIVDHGKCRAVEIDRLPRYWKNPVILCMHNLRHDNGEQGKD